MTTSARIVLASSFLILVGCGQEVVITQPEGTSHVSVDSESHPQRGASENMEYSSSIPSTTSTTSIPSSVRIAMDFAPQAPTGNWDPPYDEACEEASLIIVHHYLEGTSLNAGIMDREIQQMVAYETSIGLPIDIDMHQLARVAEGMFGYSTEVFEGADVTINQIEQELAAGNPVIVPLAGQDIGNPYFSGDGPPYHVLVILGYNNTQFITHDVGTKRGENYVYSKDVLMNALHDWNGSTETIRSGPRRVLIVKK